jgi:hypothetical protein
MMGHIHGSNPLSPFNDTTADIDGVNFAYVELTQGNVQSRVLNFKLERMLILLFSDIFILHASQFIWHV